MKYVDIKEEGVPLYTSLKTYIEDQINSGKLKPGHSLPSEQFLANKFGISRVTVRRTIEEMIADGSITRLKGRSPIVPSNHYSRDFNRLTGFSEQALASGKSIGTKLFESGVIIPPVTVARDFGLNHNEECFYIHRLRYTNGVPIAIQKIYINKKYVKTLSSEELNDKSLYTVYEERGIDLDYGVQTLNSRMPTKEERDILEIDNNTPIIVLNRTSYLKNGEPIEVTHTFSNANQYSITIKLYR